MSRLSRKRRGLGIATSGGLITSKPLFDYSVTTKATSTSSGPKPCSEYPDGFPDKRVEDYTLEELRRGWCYCQKLAREGAGGAFAAALLCEPIAARLPEGERPAEMTDERAARVIESTTTSARVARRTSYGSEISATTVGLGEIEDTIRSVDSSGKEENDILMYDQPCTTEALEQYVWMKDVYTTAQVKIQQLLAIEPSRDQRASWVDAMSRWISVAHASTGVRPRWLAPKTSFGYKGRELTTHGPAGVAAYESEAFVKAVDAGFNYYVSPMPDVFGLQPTLSQWARKGMLPETGATRCLQYEKVEIDGECTALIFCEPDRVSKRCTMPIGEQAWLRRAVMWRDEMRPIPLQDAVLASGMTGSSNPYRDKRYEQVAVATGAMIVRELREWGGHIASTPMDVLVVNQAFETYLDRLIWEAETVAAENGVSVDKILGMSTGELKSFAEEMQRDVMRRDATAIGGAVTAVGALFGPVGAAIGIIIGLLLRGLAEILPMATNPWHPPLFTYRSLRNPECRLDVVEGGTTAMLDRLVVAGEKVNFDFYNPFKSPEEADEKAPPDNEATNVPIGKGVALAAGAALGLGAAFLLT